MPDYSKLTGLLDQLNILTPQQKAEQQYKNQMMQLQTALQLRNSNIEAAKLGASEAYPVYQIEQAFNGGGGRLQIPNLPPQEDTSRQAGILQEVFTPQGVPGNDLPSQGGISGNLPKTESEKYEFAARQYAQMGDGTRAFVLSRAAAEARLIEAEEARAIQEASDKEAKARRERAAAGNPSSVYSVGAGGEEREWRRDKFDADGKYTGYEVLGKGKVGGGTDIDFRGVGEMMTAGDRSQAIEKFAAASEASENFVDAAIPVYDLLGEGAKSGFTSKILTKLDNAVATIKTTAQLAAGTTFESLGKVEAEFANDPKWKEAARKTHLSHSRLVALAYADAAAFNKDGRISDADLRASMEKLGSNLSDPESAREVLKQAIEMSKKRYDSSYNNLPYKDIRDDRKEQYERVKSKYSAFDKRFEQGAVVLSDEEKTAYEEWKKRKEKK